MDSILKANLKHFYQRRMLWLWYLVLLCQIPAFLLPFLPGRSERYLGPMVLAFFSGLTVAGLQKEILARPFSFCLPGHRQIPRRIIFWIGGIVSALMGVVFLAHPGLDLPYVLLVVCAAGFAGMLFYFWGMHVGFMNKPNPVAGFSIPLIVIGVIFFEWDRAIQHIVVSYPPVMIAAAGLICIWQWRWLGSNSLARRYCGKVTMGAMDRWDRAKAEKFILEQVIQQPSAMRIRMMEKLDKFFLAKMNRCNPLSRGRYTWGNIYIMLGRDAAMCRPSGLLGLLLMILFFLLYFSFMPVQGMSSSIYIVAAFPLTGVNLLRDRTLLLPAGRADRFHAALVSAAVVTGAVALMLMLLTALSLLLEGPLPDMTFKGHTFAYNPMDIRQSYNYLIFAPIVLLLALLFPRSIIAKIICLVVLMQLWLIFGITKNSLLSLLGPLGVTGLVLVFWLCFLIVLRHYCMKRNLVGQTKS